MSHPIDAIVIPSHAGDLHLARICIASVRYWEADIPITLIKDVTHGDFDTSDLEKHWGVSVLRVTGYGNPIAKLEALFLPYRRVLIIDADTVLIGRVTEYLAHIEGDIVVNGYPMDDPTTPEVDSVYYDFAKLRQFDPQFEYPGFVFNAGVLAMSTGILTREELADYFPKIAGLPRPIRPDIFRANDQGLLNYLFPKLAQSGRARMTSAEFYLNSHPNVTDGMNFEGILAGPGIPKVIHWPGPKSPDIADLYCAGLLRFYQDRYYARLPNPSEARSRHAMQTIKVWAPKLRLMRMRAIYAKLPRPLRPMARRAYEELRRITR